MTAYRFVNEKGFLARPSWRGVMTLATHARLLEMLANPSETLTQAFPPAKLKDLAQALETVAKCPQTKVGMIDNTTHLIAYSGTDTHQYWQSMPQYRETLCFSMLGVDTFTTASGRVNEERMPPNRETAWGLEQAVALKKFFPLLKQAADMLHQIDKDKAEAEHMAALAAAPPAPKVNVPHWQQNREPKVHHWGHLFDEDTIKKAIKFKEKLDKNIVSIKEDDPMKDVVQSDCFAIYIGGKTPGFLDGRGQISPLAGSRLFESQASAEKTITARRLRDAVVIEIGAHMKGVAPNQTVTQTMKPLQEAIAAMQKQAIMDALANATDEQLEEVIQARRPARKM